MEAWQIYSLVATAAVLVLLWPRARRLLASDAPLLRWGLIWAGAVAAVMLAYVLVLEPMGIGRR